MNSYPEIGTIIRSKATEHYYKVLAHRQYDGNDRIRGIRIFTGTGEFTITKENVIKLNKQEEESIKLLYGDA